MSKFSDVVSKVFGKRNIDAVQSVFEATAPYIIDVVMTELSDDDVRLVMNACRRRLRTVPTNETILGNGNAGIP